MYKTFGGGDQRSKNGGADRHSHSPARKPEGDVDSAHAADSEIRTEGPTPPPNASAMASTKQVEIYGMCVDTPPLHGATQGHSRNEREPHPSRHRASPALAADTIANHGRSMYAPENGFTAGALTSTRPADVVMTGVRRVAALPYGEDFPNGRHQSSQPDGNAERQTTLGRTAQMGASCYCARHTPHRVSPFQPDALSSQIQLLAESSLNVVT